MAAWLRPFWCEAEDGLSQAVTMDMLACITAPHRFGTRAGMSKVKVVPPENCQGRLPFHMYRRLQHTVEFQHCHSMA